jgi:hypothetical protein
MLSCCPAHLLPARLLSSSPQMLLFSPATLLTCVMRNILRKKFADFLAILGKILESSEPNVFTIE